MNRIVISNDMNQALEKRFVSFFRYDNSGYWLNYYSKKKEAKDVEREKVYAKIMSNFVGKDQKIVDVASGMGFLLREMYDLGLNVEGVDLFQKMIDAALKYLGKREVKITKGDILRLPYKDKSLGGVSLISIIEHLPMKELKSDVMSEIGRVLKKDGYALVHCPIRTPMSVLVRFLRMWFYRDLPKWAIDDDGDVTHKIWFTKNSCIKLFADSGFELVNYDFKLARSNMRPRGLAVFMKNFEKNLMGSDVIFERNIKDESTKVKMLKYIKSQFALTGYFLFKKK